MQAIYGVRSVSDSFRNKFTSLKDNSNFQLSYVLRIKASVSPCPFATLSTGERRRCRRFVTGKPIGWGKSSPELFQNYFLRDTHLPFPNNIGQYLSINTVK